MFRRDGNSGRKRDGDKERSERLTAITRFREYIARSNRKWPREGREGCGRTLSRLCFRAVYTGSRRFRVVTMARGRVVVFRAPLSFSRPNVSVAISRNREAHSVKHLLNEKLHLRASLVFLFFEIRQRDGSVPPLTVF